MSELKTNHIYHGNSLEVLKTFPDKSIDMVVTSPPYFNQRSYGTVPQIWGGDSKCDHDWDNQIIKGTGGGLNSDKLNVKGKVNFQITPDTAFSRCIKCGAILTELGQGQKISDYINPLCDIFDEVKRVLTDYGSCWVNIGEKNNNSGGAGSQKSKYRQRHTQFNETVSSESQSLPFSSEEVPKQSKMLIPERFVIEMVNRGWICRGKIIWEKSGAMPQSSPKKFTESYEPFYFFTKSNKPLYYINKKTFEVKTEKPLGIKGIKDIDWFINKNNKKQTYWINYSYYFKQQFTELKDINNTNILFGGNKHEGYGNKTYSGNKYEPEKLIGANMRDVWKLSTANLKENHFAAFDRKLIRVPIDACCPSQVCTQCGLPVQPFFLKGEPNEEWKKACGSDSNGEYTGEAVKDYDSNNVQNASNTKRRILESLASRYQYNFKCNCNAEMRRGIVLDPFSGSGTSSIEAVSQHKDFVGIELNKKYIKIAWKRLEPFYNPNGLW